MKDFDKQSANSEECRRNLAEMSLILKCPYTLINNSMDVKHLRTFI